MVFFDLAPIGRGATARPRSLGGVVLDGEMELTIAGETRTYRRGDRYSIPAGTVHSAPFKTRFFAIDFFAEPDRYQPKRRLQTGMSAPPKQGG